MIGGERLADRISEAAFQARVVDECAWRRLKWHHETDSRRTRSGWLDLVIAGPGGVIFAELKKAGGRATPEQTEWINTLRAAGAEVYLWRPDDWPQITNVLQRLARPKPHDREEP